MPWGTGQGLPSLYGLCVPHSGKRVAGSTESGPQVGSARGASDVNRTFTADRVLDLARLLAAGW